MNQKLVKTTTRSKKRIGRGYGSGKGGHTVGRGQKGQKSRGKISLLFEGTKTKKSLLKRLPLLRGKGKFKSQKGKPLVINLKYLSLLPKDTKVSIDSLIKYGLVNESEAREFGAKILGEGKLTKSFVVALPVSAGAREKIVKAGGRVIEEKRGQKKKNP